MSGERQMEDEAAAHRRTARLAYDSMMKVNRRGWTDEQWIADARALMDHIDGSAACLLNGHIYALFRALDAATQARAQADPSWFETRYDDEHWFPFVEDENCNITGYGHRNRADFAAAVNAYDAVCMGEPIAEDDQWQPDVIGHAWVLVDADGERLNHVAEGTPGAVPVTTLWGQR